MIGNAEDLHGDASQRKELEKRSKEKNGICMEVRRCATEEQSREKQ